MSDLDRLDRDVRWLKRYAGLVTVLLLVAGGVAFVPEKTEEEIRTRRVVVVDSTGQERIVLAAPIGTPGRRVANNGMAVRGPDGAERMALGVKSDGSVGLGLDAPPGVGVPGNPERMNLVVYSNGRAQLRFLDNQTRVQGRFLTDTASALWFEFLEWSDGDVVAYPRLDETTLQRLLKVAE